MATPTLQDNTSQNDFAEAQSGLTALSRSLSALNKQDQLQVKAHVQTVCDWAYQNGLLAFELRQLLDIVTRPNALGQASCAKIIKSLYPATAVSVDQLCIVVGALGLGSSKPSFSIQDMLLKWIIMTYEVLENPSILLNLYSVLFNMLDISSLRARLCNLLSLITRRHHVKPFRIQILKELSHSVGHEPALNDLLCVFEKYYPNTPFGEIPRGRALGFLHPDVEWHDRLEVIQQRIGLKPVFTDGDSFSFKSVKTSQKRAFALDCSKVAVSLEKGRESSVALHTIHGVADFVNNLENINVPNQSVSALDEPLLHKYLDLEADRKSIASMEKSLTSFFDAQPKKTSVGEGFNKKLSNFLPKLLDYTSHMKTLPRSAEVFLHQYITEWNGKDNRDSILSLLTYVAIQPFESLQSTLLNNLEAAILDNQITSSVTLLEFYTTLLRRWTARLLSFQPTHANAPPNTPPLSPKPPSANSTMATTSLLSLANHTTVLVLTLQATDPVPLVASPILAYLEALTFLVSHAPFHPTLAIMTPDPLTVYHLAFLPSISALSRLCSVLATYKLAFEATLFRPPPQIAPSAVTSSIPVPKHTIAHFNGFLMDLCNLLWRSRAFNTTDTNALGCLLPKPLLAPLAAYTAALAPGYSLSALSSLSCHPVLASLSIAALREAEDREVQEGEDTKGHGIKVRHAGPVSQKSLAILGREGGIVLGWKEYRLLVLGWLGMRGVGGVGELMSCTMKQLMGKEGGGNI